MAIATILVVAPGCWLFSKPTPPESSATSVEEPPQNAEEAAQLKASGYPVDGSLEFIAEVSRYASLKGGREERPEYWAVVDEVLAGALDADPQPEDRQRIHGAWAHAYATVKDPRADEQLLAAMEIEPTMWIYRLLWRKSSGYHEAHAKVCVGLRPILDEADIDEQRDFYERCSKWVGGDYSKLWPGAEEDYAALPELDEKIAKRDAVKKELSEEVAALFPGGGVCIASDCLGIGWQSYWGKEVESECVNDDCFVIGWNSTTSAGTTATRCTDRDCLGRGWRTKGALGTWVGTCTDGDCTQRGWTLERGSRAFVVTSEDEGRTYRVVTPRKTVFECIPRAQSGRGVRAGMECDLVE